MAKKELKEPEISKTEIEVILSASSEEKIKYFLEHVIKNHYAISIRNDESVLSFYDDEGQPCIPFWTHTAFTKEVTQENWADCYPTAIDLHAFQNHWLPGMNKDQVQAALFVHPNYSMALLPASELLRKLEPLHNDSCCKHKH